MGDEAYLRLLDDLTERIHRAMQQRGSQEVLSRLAAIEAIAIVLDAAAPCDFTAGDRVQVREEARAWKLCTGIVFSVRYGGDSGSGLDVQVDLDNDRGRVYFRRDELRRTDG